MNIDDTLTQALVGKPEVVDDVGDVERRASAHVREALRHVFRGHLEVKTTMDIDGQGMVVTTHVRRWTGSAVDEMGEAVAGEPSPVDGARICLHELLGLAPQLSIRGPEEKMGSWMRLLSRAARLP